MRTLLALLLLIKLVSCSSMSTAPVAKFILCDLALDKYRDHCLNSGICYNLVTAGKIDDTRIFCSCPPEYTGKRCEEILMRPTFMPFLELAETPATLKSNSRPTPVTIAARSILNTNTKNQPSEFCSNKDCASNEICKYFDSNMYRCPAERMNCDLYKKAARIPICVSTNSNEICMDSLKMGNCSTYKERYYFDVVDATCKKFYYTGCNGNRNNFATLDECVSACSSNNNMQKSVPIAPRKSLSHASNNLLQSRPQLTAPAVSRCQFTCSLNCPFGYKLNYYTNCPRCECSPLKMTECGVPCFGAGTKSCVFAMRANSRPNCDCQNSYQGTYCHIYTKSANFTVEFVQGGLSLDKAVVDEIRTSLNQKLAELLEVDRKSVEIGEICKGQTGKVVVRLSVRGPDFSTPNDFENLVEFLKYSINDNLEITVGNANYTLTQNCGQSEENFVMKLGNSYLVHKSDKFNQMTEYLRHELIQEYKFNSDSAITVKVKPDDAVRIELLIKNTANDSYFCEKSFLLQRDIRLDLFNLSNLNAQFLDRLQKLKDISFIKELTKIGNEQKREEEARNRAESPAAQNPQQLIPVDSYSALNPNFVFITVILTCLLILIFSIGLIIITQLKRKQEKEAKMNEIYGQKIYDNFERKRATNEQFSGYFLPNYTTTSQMNLITY